MLLALDIATLSGAAWGEPGSPRPEWATFKTKGELWQIRYWNPSRKRKLTILVKLTRVLIMVAA